MKYRRIIMMINGSQCIRSVWNRSFSVCGSQIINLYLRIYRTKYQQRVLMEPDNLNSKHNHQYQNLQCLKSNHLDERLNVCNELSKVTTISTTDLKKIYQLIDIINREVKCNRNTGWKIYIKLLLENLCRYENNCQKNQFCIKNTNIINKHENKQR